MNWSAQTTIEYVYIISANVRYWHKADIRWYFVTMRRHGTALGYPSILAPIVLAMFSARVVKAQCAETRAAQTNRSANDITATNAASSGASMISSIGFLTRSSIEEVGSVPTAHVQCCTQTRKCAPNQKVPVQQYFAIKV